MRKPNPDRYMRHNEYISDVVKYFLFRRRAKSKKNTISREEYDNLILEHKYEYLINEGALDRHFERVNVFSGKVVGFKKVIVSCEIELSNFIKNYLILSKHGPKIMYELSRNKHWLKEICKMKPIDAENELIFIESNLNYF